MTKPIAIFYEHPDWFKPLFAELDRRGLPYLRLAADENLFAIGKQEFPFSLLVNRASPSAYLRGRAQTTFHTLDFLREVESAGVPVVNGSKVYRYEISKIAQLQLLRTLEIDAPRSFAINHRSQALQAADQLRYPIVVKANIGGSGAGIERYESREELLAAIEAKTLPLGLDGSSLVQEYSPPEGGYIVRIEVLNGSYLYAIKVFPPEGSFDLCPADACQTADGRTLTGSACAVDAPKRGLRVEAFHPPKEWIEKALRIAQATGLDVGGIELLVDRRDGRVLVYDINALSNFVADPTRVIGFDPFVNLVDYLEARVEG